MALNTNLQALALEYAAAMVEYFEWRAAEYSGFPSDRARFVVARDKMYTAQEKLNNACQTEAGVV